MNALRERSTCMALIVAGLAPVAIGADRMVPSEYGTIQAAIDAAKAGDTIVVADGVYVGEGNRDISFGGKAIAVRSANGPEHCIIDCQGTPEVPFRGFAFESGEGRDSILEGFTISNGATLPGAILDKFNGAGILCTEGSSPTIRDCRITGSWAGCWGGAICCSFESSPLIERCMIFDNYSNDDGGGIFAWAGSSPTIVSTSITNNVSRVTGGGLTTFGGQVTVMNSTIVGNEAVVGAGVYANNTTTLVNSIVWGNEGDVDVQGNPNITHSLVAGGYAGAGNIDTVPNFVDLETGNVRLAANSPLVDAGDPNYEPADGEVDADGNARVAGPRIDMGAFEFQGAPCRADFDGDASIDFDDLINLLSHWGACAGCPQDLDQDDLVDFSDLLMVLSQWGPCP